MGESGAATVEHGVEVPVRISLSLGVLFIRIAFFFSSVLGPAAELVPSSAARARRRSAVRRMAVVWELARARVWASVSRDGEGGGLKHERGFV